MQRVAVIDLGTNTFHLLIVAIEPGQAFQEVFRRRKFVKLAEEGIGFIGLKPFQRGLKTLQEFQQIIASHQVDKVCAFGTAALRTATNGPQFIHEIKKLAQLDIQLIPGSEEARLIHKGVLQAVPFDQEKSIIMDIGGGSVEFIIADKKEVFWSQSFPIGVAVLHREWQSTDPITPQNIQRINDFFEQKLSPLLDILTLHPSNTLVGASGTFDVLQKHLAVIPPDAISSQISIAQYHPFAQSLIESTFEERRQMPDIPNDRADMIVVALILINFIIHKAQIKRIQISAYALKEGMLQEILEGKF